jgi:hypothetical protein
MDQLLQQKRTSSPHTCLRVMLEKQTAGGALTLLLSVTSYMFGLLHESCVLPSLAAPSPPEPLTMAATAAGGVLLADCRPGLHPTQRQCTVH